MSKPLTLALPFLLLSTALAACSDDKSHALPLYEPPQANTPFTPTEDAGAVTDAANATDATNADAAPNKAAQCASTFSATLTVAFGRLDGTVLAVVKPTDTQCPTYNGDHIVLEIATAGGVYRMVINVQSDRPGQDPRVWLVQKSGALPAPAWAEGWHPSLTFDYVKDLALKSTDFTPYEMNPLVEAVTAPLVVGAKVSVYATVGDGHLDSAHLVHRNGVGNDGAIVIGPDTATPSFLAFHFVNQTF